MEHWNHYLKKYLALNRFQVCFDKTSQGKTMHKLKIKLSIIALTTLLIGCEKQQINSEKSEELKIRNSAKTYEEAFNQKNAEKLASHWTKNAVFVDSLTGEMIEGRDEITNLFKTKFEENSPKIKIFIENITLNGPDKAAEKGILQTFNDDGSEDKSAYIADYVKENGEWLLEKVREIELQAVSTNYERLKDIEWLVGNWEDKDDDVDITFNCQWDEHKNFLTQRFTMKVLDQNEIEGNQVIAWDPIQENIRSWIFDSDGGFGEGFWTNEDGSWYVNVSYVLPNGQKASSINIYKKVDENAYTFASEERDIDGELLPNIEPTKVIRTKL